MHTNKKFWKVNSWFNVYNEYFVAKFGRTLVKYCINNIFNRFIKLHKNLIYVNSV